MHCRNCAKEISDKAIACPGCGVPPQTETKFCQHCGKATTPMQIICTGCGVGLRAASQSSPPAKHRSPGVMAALSFFFPGLGQLLCGQTAKGAVLLVVGFALNLVTGGIVGLLFCPLASTDAFLVAKSKQRGDAVQDWSFFPTQFEVNRKAVATFAAVLICMLTAYGLYRDVKDREEAAAREHAAQVIEELRNLAGQQ